MGAPRNIWSKGKICENCHEDFQSELTRINMYSHQEKNHDKQPSAVRDWFVEGLQENIHTHTDTQIEREREGERDRGTSFT